MNLQPAGHDCLSRVRNPGIPAKKTKYALMTQLYSVALKCHSIATVRETLYRDFHNFSILVLTLTIFIMSVLPKCRSYTASAGTQAAVLPKTGLPLQTQEPRLQFYQGLDRCGSFPSFSAVIIFILCILHHNNRENVQFQLNWSISF